MQFCDRVLPGAGSVHLFGLFTKKILAVAVKHDNSILVIGLFITVATCFGNS
jgi:hypothetical protein